MNDFTEDELNDIWCGLGWLIESEAYHNAHPIIQLRERVKSMIDTYQQPCPSSHELYEKLVCEQCGQIEDI